MARTILYKDPHLCCVHEMDSHPSGAPSEPKISESALIYYNIRGEKQVIVEGNTFRVHPGELLVIGKLNAFYVCAEPGAPSEHAEFTFSKYVFCHLDPELMLLAKITGRGLGDAVLVCCDERQNALLQSCLLHLEGLTGRAVLRCSYVSMLVLLVNEINASDLFRAAEGKQEERKLIAYINRNITSDLTLAELSKGFYVSYSQFYRLFKRLTGMTLSNYITYKRVIMARDLIQHGVKAKDAAIQCGFRDYTTFYKCNYKYFKVAPSANHPTKDNDPTLKNGIYQAV